MDAAKQDREEFIARTWPHDSLEAKRERAIQWLGPRWILHKAHSVKRKTIAKAPQ